MDGMFLQKLILVVVYNIAQQSPWICITVYFDIAKCVAYVNTSVQDNMIEIKVWNDSSREKRGSRIEGVCVSKASLCLIPVSTEYEDFSRRATQNTFS